MSGLPLPARAYLVAGDFELRPMVLQSPIRGGGYQGDAFGQALWYASIATTDLSHALAGEYKWLMANRRGALKSIYVYDPARVLPLAYALDFWVTCDAVDVTCDSIAITCDSAPAWGSPRIVAVNAAASTIDLDGFQPGAVISEGDYGHWDDGATRRLHICGAAVADGAGLVTGLAVEPPPPASSASLPASFTMAKASAEMLILKSGVPFSGLATSKASIEAIQTLRSE